MARIGAASRQSNHARSLRSSAVGRARHSGDRVGARDILAAPHGVATCRAGRLTRVARRADSAPPGGLATPQPDVHSGFGAAWGRRSGHRIGRLAQRGMSHFHRMNPAKRFFETDARSDGRWRASVPPVASRTTPDPRALQPRGRAHTRMDFRGGPGRRPWHSGRNLRMGRKAKKAGVLVGFAPWRF
jgi:hypothetical protein